MDVEGLTEIIAGYEYGQFNILDNGLTIKYNPVCKKVKFDPFYRHGFNPTKGSCVELMNTAYTAIRKKFPQYHVMRASGKDAGFFKMKGATHHFLLLFDSDPLPGCYQITHQNQIKKVISDNPLLVDPSFGYVIPYANSRYTVKELVNQGCEVPYSNTAVLEDAEAIPLGIDSTGSLVGIRINFLSPQIIDMCVVPKNARSKKDLWQKRLNSDEIDKRFATDLKVSRLVQLLREREKIETQDEFSKETAVLI